MIRECRPGNACFAGHVKLKQLARYSLNTISQKNPEFDGFAKSPEYPLIVIPAFAGMTRFLAFYETIKFLFENSQAFGGDHAFLAATSYNRCRHVGGQLYRGSHLAVSV